MKRVYVMIVVLGCAAGSAAWADSTLDSKLRCQMEYGSGSEMDVACERGVDLGAHASDAREALRGCRDTTDQRRAAACQHGIELHGRAADKTRGDVKGENRSNFSYSWKKGGGAVGVTVGDYQALVGDAQEQIEECMRSYEGSSTPPSCLSGFKVQRKPPEPPPIGSGR